RKCWLAFPICPAAAAAAASPSCLRPPSRRGIWSGPPNVSGIRYPAWFPRCSSTCTRCPCGRSRCSCTRSCRCGSRCTCPGERPSQLEIGVPSESSFVLFPCSSYSLPHPPSPGHRVRPPQCRRTRASSRRVGDWYRPPRCASSVTITQSRPNALSHRPLGRLGANGQLTSPLTVPGGRCAWRSFSNGKRRPPACHGCRRSELRWSRGGDPRLLRLTLDRLPDHASGARPRGSKAPPCLKARLPNTNVLVLLCHLRKLLAWHGRTVH